MFEVVECAPWSRVDPQTVRDPWFFGIGVEFFFCVAPEKVADTEVVCGLFPVGFAEEDFFDLFFAVGPVVSMAPDMAFVTHGHGTS